MPNCFIMIRVSSKSQEKGYSLQTQRKDLPALAKKNDLEFADSDIYDFGVASTSISKDMERWTDIIDVIKSGRYNDGYMVLREIDRSHRDLGFGLNLISLFYEHNISILTPTGKYDSRDLGSIILKVVKYYSAEDEKRKRTIEQKRARKEAKDSGIYLSSAGNPPDGYWWDKNTKELKPNNRAEIMKEILTKPTWSNWQLLHWIRENKIKGKRGGNISTNHIKRIRQCPIYAGYMFNSKGKLIKARNVIPIITKKIYQTNVDHLKKQKNYDRHPLTAKYFLIGRLRCGFCGYAMTSAINKNKNRYGYRCYGKVIKICEESMQIVMHKIDGIVEDNVINYYGNYEKIKKSYNNILKEYNKTNKIKKIILSEIKALEKQRENLIDAVAQGISLKGVQKKGDLIEKQIDEKKQSLSLQRKPDLKKPKEIYNAIKLFPRWPLNKKRQFINDPAGIKKILYYNSYIEIYYQYEKLPQVLSIPGRSPYNKNPNRGNPNNNITQYCSETKTLLPVAIYGHLSNSTH